MFFTQGGNDREIPRGGGRKSMHVLRKVAGVLLQNIKDSLCGVDRLIRIPCKCVCRRCE